MSKFTVPEIRETKSACYKMEALDKIFEFIDREIKDCDSTAENFRSAIEQDISEHEEAGNPIDEEDYQWTYSYKIEQIQEAEAISVAMKQFKAVLRKKFLESWGF